MFWIGLGVGFIAGGMFGGAVMSWMAAASRSDDDLERIIEALPLGDPPGDFQRPRADRVRVADKLG